MATSPFIAAINQIADEKGLDTTIILETVEAALAAAYRKDYGNQHQVIRAELNPETMEMKMYQVYTVVEDELLEEPESQKILKDARKMRKDAELGEEVEIELPVHTEFGRIAAQTAKQVIIQRIREAEREMLYNEFKDKEGQLLNGNVQQIEGDIVIINLGRINALLLPTGQMPNERYYVGQRLKVYVQGVEETAKGPKVVVSRADTGLIAALFALEVPEIASGAVEIKAIAREAGARTKMAVASTQEGLDPVGSCVGQRGTRVQSVLAEIGDEKIDIILWDEDTTKFIGNALSPAKIEAIELIEETRKAKVIVNEDQLSLAIGRGGQNVRLASKLTLWSIDIEKIGEENAEEEVVAEVTPSTGDDVDEVIDQAKEDEAIAESVEPAVDTPAETADATKEVAKKKPAKKSSKK
jgi:N utilization substance protein A